MMTRIYPVRKYPLSLTPPNLPGILFWGDVERGANLVSTNIDSLTNLINQGVYTATAPASGNRPAYNASGINGKPGAVFTGASNHSLNSATGFPNTGAYWKVALHMPTLLTTSYSNIYSSNAGPALATITGYQYQIYHGSTAALARSWAFNNTPMVSVAQWTGSVAEIYHNGLKVASTAAASRPSATDFALGTYGGANGYDGTGMIWLHGSGTLTQTQINQITDYMFSRVNIIPEHFVFDGDSLTTKDYTTYATAMPTYFRNVLPTTTVPTVVNDAISGHTFADAEPQAVTNIDTINFGATHTQKTLIIWLGTNDIANSGRTAAQVFNDLKTYITNRMAVNTYNRVAVLTLIPRADQTLTTTLFAYNQYLRDNWSQLTAVGATHLVDLVNIPEIDSYTDLTNTSYFNADKIHLTDQGNQLVGEYLADQLGYITAVGATDIADTAIWMTSDTVATSGSAVTSWTNQAPTGGSYSPAQATGANQPTLVSNVLNGKAAIRFDGTSDFLEFPSAAYGITNNIPGLSVFMLFSAPNNATAQRLLFASNGLGTSGTRVSISKDAAANYYFDFGGRRLDADSFASIKSTSAITTAHKGTWLFDYANNDLFYYRNGSLNNSTTSFLTAGNTSATASQRMRIGTSGTGTEFLAGDMFAMIIIPRKVTRREQLQIEKTLKNYGGV